MTRHGQHGLGHARGRAGRAELRARLGQARVRARPAVTIAQERDGLGGDRLRRAALLDEFGHDALTGDEVGHRVGVDGDERLAERVGERRQLVDCLLYTSDAADERYSVDFGGRRIIKKKTNKTKKNDV